MDSVTEFAGQTITVGAVASFLAQWIKGKEWFPVRYRAVLVRMIVAGLCVGINAGVAFTTGTLDPSTLAEAFFSYVVAAAAYDHLFS
jgi:hypothetical protein